MGYNVQRTVTHIQNKLISFYCVIKYVKFVGIVNTYKTYSLILNQFFR